MTPRLHAVLVHLPVSVAAAELLRTRHLVAALICRTASMVARPITSITSSMARSPFLQQLGPAFFSSRPSFALASTVSSRLFGVDAGRHGACTVSSSVQPLLRLNTPD